ncbi:MAG: nuclear transport factor 2 family protein [Marinomonas sp.]
MSDSITTFFEAWQVADAESRLAKITSSVTDNIRYDDPRTPDTLEGIEALNNYVGMFSANAPGWTAKVVKSDTVASVTRVTVAFGGMGPDGSQQVQLGQYFVEMEGDLVSRMVGFVGTGEGN